MRVEVSDVIASLERVVAAAGRSRRAQCYYSVEGEAAVNCSSNEPPVNPICIAGAVVKDLTGVMGLRSLTENTKITSPENRRALDRFGFSQEAIRVLGVAQSAQDRGHTWGDALQAAHDIAGDSNYANAVFGKPWTSYGT